MSYRIKIYIQYHYVYYIYTLCLYLIYLHLIYSHLIYSHLIYSHLIYSHLIYLPFKFTSIIFQKIRRCAPHIETYQTPPPSLSAQPSTSNTVTYIYRPQDYFTPNNPSGRSPPSAQPSVSNTAAYRHKSTKLPPSTTKHSKKSPRSVQRGRGFAAPLRFSFFPQKNTVRHSPKKQTPHSI